MQKIQRFVVASNVTMLSILAQRPLRPRPGLKGVWPEDTLAQTFGFKQPLVGFELIDCGRLLVN